MIPREPKCPSIYTVMFITGSQKLRKVDNEWRPLNFKYIEEKTKIDYCRKKSRSRKSK
jgi:hypothetical protein